MLFGLSFYPYTNCYYQDFQTEYKATGKTASETLTALACLYGNYKRTWIPYSDNEQFTTTRSRYITSVTLTRQSKMWKFISEQPIKNHWRKVISFNKIETNLKATITHGRGQEDFTWSLYFTMSSPIGYYKWFRSLPGVKIDAVGVKLFEWNF